MPAGFFYGLIRLGRIRRVQQLHRDTLVVEVEEGDTRICQVRREILARRDRIIRVVVAVAVEVEVMMMVGKNVNVMSMLFCKRKFFCKIIFFYI